MSTSSTPRAQVARSDQHMGLRIAYPGMYMISDSVLNMHREERSTMKMTRHLVAGKSIILVPKIQGQSTIRSSLVDSADMTSHAAPHQRSEHTVWTERGHPV